MSSMTSSSDNSSPELNITTKDLDEELKALQKAFAEERGANNRFRKEVLILLHRWLTRTWMVDED